MPALAYGSEMSCENNTCSISICITNSDEFVYISAEDNGGTPVYEVDHYDVINDDDASEKYLGNTLTSCVHVSGTQGDSKTYTVKPYLTRGTSKHYSPETGGITVEFVPGE